MPSEGPIAVSSHIDILRNKYVMSLAPIPSVLYRKTEKTANRPNPAPVLISTLFNINEIKNIMELKPKKVKNKSLFL